MTFLPSNSHSRFRAAARLTTKMRSKRPFRHCSHSGPVRLAVQLAVLALAALLAVGWIDPKADEINRANSLLKEGRYEDALKIYENVVVKYPDDLTGRLNSAIALYAAGRYQDSSARFGEVLAVLPSSEEQLSPDTRQLIETISHYGLGCSEFKLGSALESLAPSSSADGAASSNVSLAAAAEHYRRALNSFLKALRLDPSDEDARHNYQLTYAKLKELEELLSSNTTQQENEQPNDSQQGRSGEDKEDQDGQTGESGQSDQDKQNSQGNESGTHDEKEMNESQEQGQNEQKDEGEEKQGQPLQQQAPDQSSMSVEEALRLLEMMDASDQYGVLVQRQDVEGSGQYPDW